jgi:hypothetical protein
VRPGGSSLWRTPADGSNCMHPARGCEEQPARTAGYRSLRRCGLRAHNRVMRLEYFDDPSLDRPVLLLFGDDSTEAKAVHDLVTELASSRADVEVQLDDLPVVQSVDSCTLAAAVGQTDIGVELIGDDPRAFRCTLQPESWRTAAGLIEPFTVPRRGASVFQYLTGAGSIEWIISTSRQW